MSLKFKLLVPIILAALAYAIYYSSFYRTPVPQVELQFNGSRRSLAAVLSRHTEKCETLIIYLHGLGGKIGEPYKNPSTKRNYALEAFNLQSSKVDFSSIDFGTPGLWVHGKDFEDITCGIKELLVRTGAERIVLAGSSMGGSAALTFAALAPDDIKRKVIGVVAIYPVADFAALYRQTKAPEITLSMDIAFGGGPNKYARDYAVNSLSPSLDKLLPTCRIYIISAEADVVAPRQLQLDLAEQLKKANVACKLESLPCTHLKPPPVESFSRGLDFVMKGKAEPK